jgi:hypothetical protein
MVTSRRQKRGLIEKTYSFTNPTIPDTFLEQSYSTLNPESYKAFKMDHTRTSTTPRIFTSLNMEVAPETTGLRGMLWEKVFVKK